MQKIITADYLRHNLKDVVLEVMNGDEIVLKYGYLGEIKLVAKKPIKKSKKDRLIDDLKKITKFNKKEYSNNRELYDDLSTNFIK